MRRLQWTAGNESLNHCRHQSISAWAHAVGAMDTNGCRIATSDPHLQASHTTVPCAQLDQMLSDADPCTLTSPSESSRTWLRTLGDELRTGARRELRVAVFGGSISLGSLTNQSYVTRLQAYLERGFSSAGLSLARASASARRTICASRMAITSVPSPNIIN